MSEYTLPGHRPESSLQVWTQLLASLQRSGFQEAGPEYLKLSRLVTDARKARLLAGTSDGEEPLWQQLREVGAQAEALLEPLLTAARLLAEMPQRIAVPHEAPAAQEALEPPVQTRNQPPSSKTASARKPRRKGASAL